MRLAWPPPGLASRVARVAAPSATACPFPLVLFRVRSCSRGGRPAADNCVPAWARGSRVLLVLLVVLGILAVPVVITVGVVLVVAGRKGLKDLWG